MASLALVFDILARDEASAEFEKVGGAADRAGEKGTKFGTVMGAGLAAAGAAAIAFGVSSISAASDLSETLSKTNVVFGDSASEIVKWSEGSAKAFGLSQQAALGAASQFGDMFHQLGFTQEASAKTSENVVKLAADLGSFHNVDPSEVLDKIGGALKGEFDSLQALIPNISAATVAQEALRETHKKSAADLTAAEKATATLTLIQRDGANAANDFAETSGGLANQQRILKAEFANVQATVGAKLLPVMVDLAGEFQSLIEFVSRNTDVLGPLAAALAAGGAAYLVVSKAIAVTNVVLAAFKVGAAESGTAMTVALGPIGLVVIGLAALAAGLVYAYKHSETFRNVVSGAFQKVRDAIGFVIDRYADLLSGLGHVPGFGWAKDAAAKLHGAADAARGVKNAIEQIPRDVQIRITTTRIEDAADDAARRQVVSGHRALGGAVRAGSAYTIGELGPETFVPRSAGTVLPAGASIGTSRVEALLEQQNELLRRLPREYQLGMRAGYGV